MSRHLIAMGMGMGVMPGGKSRFFLGVVGRVGMRVTHGVVPVILIVALFVLAGQWPVMGLRIRMMRLGFVSRRHSQYSGCPLIKRWVKNNYAWDTTDRLSTHRFIRKTVCSMGNEHLEPGSLAGLTCLGDGDAGDGEDLP